MSVEVTADAARRKIRAVVAIRRGLLREVNQAEDFLRLAEAVKNGLKTQRPATAIQEDVPYWQDKKAVLERMIALLDQSKAANEAIIASETEAADG